MSTEQFLYLTTTGRVTGQARQIEIWYVEHNGCYYIVSEHREKAHWVRNFQKQPAVNFSVGTGDEPESARRRSAAFARAVTDPELLDQVRALMNSKYGWSNGLVVELNPE